MAWEPRGQRKYFYRSVRQDGRVKKLYYGRGALGDFAANVVALRRAERQADEDTLRASQDLVDNAVMMTAELCRLSYLMAAAELLAAGFHRSSRHNWRVWRHGRKTIPEARRAN